MVVPVSLQQGESASECYCLAVKEGVSKLKVVNIGSLALQWRRTSAADKFPVVVTELTFPSVTVESVPFAIQAGTFPARLIIRQYAKRQNQTILEK
ncbi:unnamed protein product, partial [Pocillopora meandrina]